MNSRYRHKHKLILEQRKASGAIARFANTSPVFGEGPNGFVGWGYSKARLDERLAAQRKKGKPMPDWTLHDLRRTAATMMAELGVLPHIIEAILNHISAIRVVWLAFTIGPDTRVRCERRCASGPITSKALANTSQPSLGLVRA